MRPTTYTLLDPSSPTARARGRCALAVMTKAPRAGESKTRLAPPLTREEAADLSACFLRDTAANVAAACAALGAAAQGVAAYTPAGAEDDLRRLLPDSFALLTQRGETFGERLWNAARDLFADGYDSLCLVDSDSPTLPTRALVAAVEELSKPGERVVLGAADDGGYYLMASSRRGRGSFRRSIGARGASPRRPSSARKSAASPSRCSPLGTTWTTRRRSPASAKSCSTSRVRRPGRRAPKPPATAAPPTSAATTRRTRATSSRASARAKAAHASAARAARRAGARATRGRPRER